MAALEWNETQRATLRKLWTQTAPRMSAEKIAEHMGTSQGSVMRQVRTLGLPARGGPANIVAARLAEHMAALEWNETQRATLRKLWMQTAPWMSAKKIAARMGTSQGSVMRQARTLDLPTRRHSASIASAARWAGHAAKAPEPKKPTPAPDPAPERRMTQAQPQRAPVQRQDCAWPTWHVKDAAYRAAIRAGRYLQCDAPTGLRTLPDGSHERAVYCDKHMSIAGSRRHESA